MKRKLQDLLPLLNEARRIYFKACWDENNNDMFIYKNNKYYEITSDGEEEISEKVIKKMWQLTFGIKFDDMIK